jgi:lysozyme
MNNMTYSATGRALTEHCEGLRTTAYQDSVGIWTIGYGHTTDVHAGMVCDQDQADQWLEEDIQGAAYVVNKVVTAPLNQNQFDALVDFVFNLGAGNFQSSTLLKLLNQGDYAGASNEFPKWNHAGGKELAGLTVRRLAEQKLFDTPITLGVPPLAQSTPDQPQKPTCLISQLQTWVNALRGKFSDS